MAYVPIKGFAPDADPHEPGVLVDCDLLVPTLNGMAALAGDVDAGVDAAASAVASAISVTKLDGTRLVFAGTEGSGSGGDTSTLYLLSTTSWTEVSESRTGTAYTASAAARWVFAQYGDEVFAAQRGAGLQSYTSTEFDDVTLTYTAVSVGIMKAAIVETVLDFVMLFNVTDESLSSGSSVLYSVGEDRWWCSAAGDTTSWTPNIATQANTGRLTDSPGAIVAAKKLGSSMVAYKRRSMYLGQYVGAPLVWAWRQVPGEDLGTYSPYAVVDVEGIGHFFPGNDQFYVFDGTRAQPISTNRVSRFFLEALDFEEADRMFGYHDRAKNQIFWWFPTGQTGGTCDTYLCYNYRSDRWGYGKKTIQFAFEYTEPGVTYNTLPTYIGAGTTYNGLPAALGVNATYDGAFSTFSTPEPAVFDTANTIQKLTGAGNNSSYNTGNIGIDGVVSLVDRVRPRFKTAPSSGTQDHYITDTAGSASAVVSPVTALNEGSFDHVYAGRWHSFRHAYTGSMELLGIDIQIREDSLE